MNASSPNHLPASMPPMGDAPSSSDVLVIQRPAGLSDATWAAIAQDGAAFFYARLEQIGSRG